MSEMDESLDSEESCAAEFYADNNSEYSIKSEKLMTTTFLKPSVLSEFIELYKSYPSLWQTDHEDYSNRVKRKEALKVLLKYTRQFIPGATLRFIRKRIQVMRGVFRKEFRKVDRYGASKGKVYTPKLWYYNSLSFIAGLDKDTHNGDQTADSSSTTQYDIQEHFIKEEVQVEREDCDEQESGSEKEIDLPHTSRSNRSRPDTFQVIQEQPNIQSEKITPDLDLDVSVSNEEISKKNGSQDTPVNVFATLKRPKPLPDNARTTRPQEMEVVGLGEEECDMLGSLIASKLRKMDPLQRLHADKLISDVLYKGLLGNLTDTYYIGEYQGMNRCKK